MTLCLAWKQGEKVYFAADSRLTAGQHTVTDDATKIFKVGVEIYDSTPASAPRDTVPQLVHRTNFGLCFAGSYLNGSLFADTIEEVLSNVQVAPGISDYTIGNLASVAFAVYKEVSRQLMQINRSNGLSEVLLGGNCPVKGVFKLYRFYSTQPTADSIVGFQVEEIDLERHPYFIGDAKQKAEELTAKLSQTYSPYHLLRQVIQDSSTPSVGGNIQTGIFGATGFKTCGIMEYAMFTDDYGVQQVRDSFRFRNLLLDLDATEFRPGNINILKTFVNPFESEREDYFQQIFDNLNKEVD